MKLKVILTIVFLLGNFRAGYSGSPDEREDLPASSDKDESTKEMERSERIKKNDADFKALQKVDSVGWLKVKAIKRSDDSMEEMERERLQRKSAAIREFCKDGRFEKVSELDSIKGMTANERTFCRERLLLSNPLMK